MSRMILRESVYRIQYNSIKLYTHCSILGIYKEIVSALEKIQEVDARVDKIKFEFQAKMDTKYQELHENLIEQCKQVIHEAKEQKAHQLKQANEIKVQLNEKVKDINIIC